MGATDPASRGRVCNWGVLLKLFGLGALMLALAGCYTTADPVAVVPADVGPTTTAKLQDPDDVKYYRSDEPLRMGIERFDLADRAYTFAIRLVGETTEILNNQGYSYMLRGDLVNARRKFLKAYEREPNNPTIANNLQLLNSSSRFIQRSPAQ